MPPSSSVRTSYGDAAKSSLPSVSLLFASQSRPNVSPGNGHEFYSGLIFLVPIVVCEARRARFAINHLRRYRYSPPRGCIPNFSVIPRAKKWRRGRRESSTTPLSARISLLRLLLLLFLLLLLLLLFFSFFFSFPPSRKQEFRKRPRGPWNTWEMRV